jgi:4-oxalocrotonate tautomerase
MSGDVPDVRSACRADHGVMPFIQVKVIEGVYTAPQKQAIVERLTDAMVEITGETMRRLTWCVVEEVASGDWGIGGQTITADDIKALARSEAPGEPG